MANGTIYSPKQPLWTMKTGALYSGDGISAYSSENFVIPITNVPVGYLIAALKEAVSSNGDFIISCLNINNSDKTVTVKLFNCTSSTNYPGTITVAVLTIKGA